MNTKSGISQTPGLPPLIGKDPKILILGSYPSLQSLERSAYYANPRNQFWGIVEFLWGIDRKLSYSERIAFLVESKVALWDVIYSCSRTGSSDSKIRGIIPNDIQGFVNEYPSIKSIGLNGTTAGRYFARYFPKLDGTILPSTSPANARMNLEEKIQKWKCLNTETSV